MAPAAWVAMLALSAARGGDPVAGEARRTAAEDLARACTLIRRAGNLQNQAVRGMHASGRPDPEVREAAIRTARAAEHVARLADDVIRALR
jgi:hypothetical protein